MYEQATAVRPQDRTDDPASPYQGIEPGVHVDETAPDGWTRFVIVADDGTVLAVTNLRSHTVTPATRGSIDMFIARWGAPHRIAPAKLALVP